MGAARSVTAPSDRVVERVVRWRTLIAIVAANLAGTAAIFGLGALVLVTGDVGTGEGLRVNLVAAALYIGVGMVLGTRWGLMRTRPGRQWMREDRTPSAAEQRNLLRAPLYLFFLQAGLWLGAAIFLAVVNASYFSLEFGQRVGFTVALGGLTTGAVTYLLAERLLRPAAARALAARPLERPALPGVTGRTLFAWALGTVIPLLGLASIGLSTLTEGDFTRNELAVAILALGAAILVSGFILSLLAARATAAPIVSVRRALAEVEDGDLDVSVPVFDGTEVGLLQSGFNRMVSGLRERERIREVFGHQVGEEVARSALEGDVELGGEVREVAVLFVDVIGSTRLAATRPPSEVVELLNAFFAIVIDVVDRHGGWVNKFEGDAALCVFGVPVPLDAAPARTLEAARVLGERLQAELPGIEAGVGAASGSAVAGNVGDPRRYEYTVIGDPVNEAARLTELAKEAPGRVAASGAIVEAAGGEEAGRWRSHDEVVLRGRTAPTPVMVPET